MRAVVIALQIAPAALIHHRGGVEDRQFGSEQRLAVAQPVIENGLELICPLALANVPECRDLCQPRLQVRGRLLTGIGVIDLDRLLRHELLAVVGYVDLTVGGQLLAVILTGRPVIVPQRSRDQLREVHAAEDVVRGRRGVKVHRQFLNQINVGKARDVGRSRNSGIVTGESRLLQRVILLDHPLGFLLGRKLGILRYQRLTGRLRAEPGSLSAVAGVDLMLKQEVVALHQCIVQGVLNSLFTLADRDRRTVELIVLAGFGGDAVLIIILSAGGRGIHALHLLKIIIVDTLAHSEDILVKLIQRLHGLAVCFVDQRILSVLHLFGQDISADIVAVVKHVDQAGIRGIRHADLIRDTVNRHIAQVGLVSVVGEHAVLL